MGSAPQAISPIAKALAATISAVVSGCGAWALITSHAPERSTRFGITDALDGNAAQLFGLCVFLFGLIPLIMFARTPRQAAGFGAALAALGLVALFTGIKQLS